MVGTFALIEFHCCLKDTNSFVFAIVFACTYSLVIRGQEIHFDVRFISPLQQYYLLECDDE
jgi:hypothetical protein